MWQCVGVRFILTCSVSVLVCNFCGVPLRSGVTEHLNLLWPWIGPSCIPVGSQSRGTSSTSLFHSCVLLSLSFFTRQAPAVYVPWPCFKQSSRKTLLCFSFFPLPRQTPAEHVPGPGLEQGSRRTGGCGCVRPKFPAAGST